MNIRLTMSSRLTCTVLLLFVLPLMCLAVSPEIRFMPIRQAPLGSPVGTVGDPVTPIFSTTLNCWEVRVPVGGAEIDLDLQGFGWGSAAGAPLLGAIQATLDATGLANGVGTDLNPKGWPARPADGAYQATNICVGPDGDGSPCVAPFDSTCGGLPQAFCAQNPDWVMPACAMALAAISTPSLNYGWAAAAQSLCAEDDGQVKTFGGLILDVPAAARGTYTISVQPDRNESFMTRDDGTPVIGVVFTSACITVLVGDFDGDRSVTLSDYRQWQQCETGPVGGPYLAGCEVFDSEPNDLVDLRDYAWFQSVFDAP